MTDEVLLERACQGDEAAFGRLYERFRSPLYALAYRLTGSVAIAEDLVHDAILSVVRPTSRFDPARGRLRTYLYAAIRNLARKEYRDYGREEGGDDLAAAAAGSSPLDSLVSAETCERVQAAVSALPGLQREALVLFEYDDLSLAEIAAVMGADSGTVKSRLFRAREKLRVKLDRYFRIGHETATVRRA